MNWSEIIYYNPEKGLATWKYRGISQFSDLRTYKSWNARHKGKIAGSIHTDETGRKCIHLKINKRCYKAHRVFWEITHGPIPEGMTVDHIDQNPLNNKITNLRLATQQDQKRNMPIPKHNTSGVVGVQKDKRSGKWRARIGVGGKSIDLGLCDSFDDAVSLRKAAEISYGFHPNHASMNKKHLTGEQP